MNRIIYFIPLIVIGLFALIALNGLNDTGNKGQATSLEGRDLPFLPENQIDGFEGGEISQIVNQNELVLVNFWASWCAPCRAEHPNLETLREAGYEIIGVNFKDPSQNAQKFLNEMGNPFSAIRADNTGRVGIEWGVAGVPETFIVQNGKIVDRHTGPILDRNYDEFIAKLKQYKSNN